MKDQILKIAKVKSEKEFYKKYPTEEAFMAKHGKTLQKAAMGTKMVNKQLKQLTDFSNPPIAQAGGSWANVGIPGLSTATYDASTGLVNNASGVVSKSDTAALGFADKAPGAGGFDMAGAAMAGLNALPKIIGGIQAIGSQKKNIRKAEQAAKISDIVAQAAESKQVGVQKHNFVRPEDSLLTGAIAGGSGTNYLAANGTEIQNTYTPGTLYSDLGYEPLNDSNLKQYAEGGWMNPEYNPQVIAKFGEYDVKDLLKPPHDADMLRAGGHLKEYTPPSEEAMYTGRGQFAMGGDLQVHRGKAEPISYNPFLPEGGETVMFRGPSHDDGGMPISYGQNGVEVEGGEPAVKLQDGGSPDGNLVVFGNMKIDDMAAKEIGIDSAKGKKYKNFINDLSKFEKKQNKTVNKGTELVNLADTNDPFDQLAMNSGQAMIMGGNAKLQKAAAVKQNTAAVQNAILDTAKQLGVKSDALAEGRLIKDKKSNMAKFGAKMETAQAGYHFDPITKQMVLDDYSDYTESAPVASQFVDETGGDLPNSPIGKLFTADQIAKGKGKGGTNWGDVAQTIMSNAMPLFRPTDQEPLDPSQLMPEYFALASNQLEPVRAQQYRPRLKEAYSLSLQDQLNEVDQQARAAQRMAGNNAAAQAQIAAQAAEQKNKIRGEQLRMNQGLQMGVYNENIGALNQAQAQNLQILDQQYARQAQAKSNTKAQTQAALSSIASKIAQNKLENRQLGIYENLYNYRFGPRGQAINFNDPYRFNMEGTGKTNQPTAPEGYEFVTELKKKKEEKSRNGSIVKALKNL